MLTKEQVTEFGDFLLLAIDAHLSRKLLELENKASAMIEKRISELRVEFEAASHKCSPEEVRKMIDESVQTQEQIDELIERAAAKIEVVVPEPVHGKDGKDAPSLQELSILVEGMLAKAVLALPHPRDGEDGKSVTIDDVLPVVRAMVENTLAEWPKPKDGRDAVSVNDIDITSVDGGRSIKFAFKAGDDVIVREIENDFVIDRGAWREALQAKRGDLVTHAGSTWLAQRATTDRPGTSDAWRMAVKSAIAKTQQQVRL